MPDSIGKRIRSMRKDMGLTQLELSEIAGIGQSTLSDIESGEKKPSAETTIAIARALHTVPSYLLGEKSCSLCGFEYTYDEGLDSESHKIHHITVENIIKRHGFYWPYQRRLHEMNEAHMALMDDSASMSAKYDSALNLFKALFCRSLFSYPRLDHPSFSEYVSLLLGGNHKEYFEDIPDEVITMLKEKYGTKEGMTSTFYQPLKAEALANDSRMEKIVSALPHLSDQYLGIIEAIISNAEKE